MGGACNTHGEINSYSILLEISEGETPFRKPRRGWSSDIKMDLKEVVCGGVDWSHLIRD
jgi:hypothetical protein